MKAALIVFFGSIFFFISESSLAGCGTCEGNACNPYETSCQCTDPACFNPLDSNCISRAECCEAFGNMGAR